MRRIGGLVLAVLALAGCGEGIANCGGCQDPHWLNVAVTGRTPVGLPVRVCIEKLPCATAEAPREGEHQVSVRLPDGVEPSSLDGRRVGLSADGQGFDAASFVGDGRLRYHEARGECGCSYLGATAEVTQNH